MPLLDPLPFLLTLVAARGCALVGGIFFAFSNFVMKALARIPPASGIAAIQSINIVVLNPLFLTLFLGTAGVCLTLMIVAAWQWRAPGAICWVAGGILYLLGTVMVTAAFNVPRNDALARIDASAPEAAATWRGYVSSWTSWNHVRTTAALTAAALFTFALNQL
jgi:uncharacterized membrane protein